MSGLVREPPVPQAVILLLGPAFIGCMSNWLLMGISTVQLYIYHISFRDDHKSIQALVYTVFFLDVFGAIVAGALGWHILVDGWGRNFNLVTPGWTFAGIGAVDGITATLVQFFYAWRIWFIKKWVILPGAIVLIALAQLGAVLAIVVGIANLQNVDELITFFPRTVVWLGGGALADVLISISMVSLLLSAKKNMRTVNRDERPINRLIALSVETGVITAVSAIVELGLFLSPATSGTHLHLLFALILGKLYSNSLMSSLNARAASRREKQSVAGMSSHSHSGGHAQMRSGIVPPIQSRPVVHISSHTEVFDGPYRDRKSGRSSMGKDDLELLARPVPSKQSSYDNHTYDQRPEDVYSAV